VEKIAAQGRPRVRKASLVAIAVAASLTTIIATPGAFASDQNEVRNGAAVVAAVDAGRQTCTDLTESDFEAAGEYSMERMVGSVQGHEAMDQAMTRMVGASALESMHRFLGERITGCAGAPAPPGFAGMMGMIGLMSSGMMGYGPGPGTGPIAGGGPASPGITGGYPNQAFGMMGASGSSGDDDDWSPAATAVALILGGFLVLLAAGGIVAWRRQSKPSASGPLATLDARLARGEIDEHEYQQRRDALRAR
jgi:uncharacterized membrane protein